MQHNGMSFSESGQASSPTSRRRHAVALGHNEFPVLATGKSFSNDFALHFTVQDGQITGYQMYEDTYAVDQAFTPTN